MTDSRKDLGFIDLVCVVVAAVCVVVFFNGCGPSKEARRPAPSSSLSKARWQKVCDTWVAIDKERNSWTTVKPTGSMAPYIDSKSLLLVERVTGPQLLPGDVAIYDDLGGGSIVHTVREVNTRGAVLFTGDNNSGTQPDGWIAANRILWRVTANLNTNGS